MDAQEKKITIVVLSVAVLAIVLVTSVVFLTRTDEREEKINLTLTDGRIETLNNNLQVKIWSLWILGLSKDDKTRYAIVTSPLACLNENNVVNTTIGDRQLKVDFKGNFSFSVNLYNQDESALACFIGDNQVDCKEICKG